MKKYVIQTNEGEYVAEIEMHYDSQIEYMRVTRNDHMVKVFDKNPANVLSLVQERYPDAKYVTLVPETPEPIQKRWGVYSPR